MNFKTGQQGGMCIYVNFFRDFQHNWLRVLTFLHLFGNCD